MTHRAAHLGVGMALAAVTVLTTGCTGSGTGPPVGTTAAGELRQSLPSTAPVDLMPVVPQPPSTVGRTNRRNERFCRPGPGRTVTRFDPLVIPEERVEPLVLAGERRGAVATPSVTVAGFVVPEVTVDLGCIVEEEAPPGCLGAVTITGYEVPAVRIPGASLPSRPLPGGSVLPAATARGDRAAGTTVPEVSTPAVCGPQVRLGRRAAVRPALIRRAATRPALTRATVTQPSRTVTVPSDGGDRLLVVPPFTLDPVTVEPVLVEPVSVPPAILPFTALGGADDVDVADGSSRDYVAPAGVLFAEESHVLRPGARVALRAILDDLRRHAPTGPVTVAGYTDDQGSAAFGMTLSRARARAVARWLVGEARLPRPRIESVVGYGEAHPAYPNTSEANMARNRRVVVSASR